ncbi:pyridoxine 5'-phosphate synthase [Candidatus Desantisbacteria bacterium CG_4_9_14_3_um_filter_40_11]|uniref:Pyridoxine 5'-phosphate synthase n=2 Tax=unclassified Candidatus Desantisiibacteriota TaxID=3106372 RepID=A0A2M7JBH4_9BACT|nr:MAG: pyridoxine 5'-phosphate synthase [Candidatus Desantisbacteria bacterium CG_4_8_14_3_um_filter_40_12]PJB28574.1 MAG: pyridoxine 5'-phosphate synthase [Candidatus Desantisbacteria bacterium CG_4_9_14_3_um_filter_40_11]
MSQLGVNIDHVATIRQVRGGKEPDPVKAALIAELAGCDSIVCHLREDKRHIQERDVRLLKELVQTKLNLEMAATDAMVKFALNIKPNQVTLVPERREELTTEGGLDVISQREKITAIVSLLQEQKILVSLFIEPDIAQIRASAKTNAMMIEIHTGQYANSVNPEEELEKIVEAVSFARKQGLRVVAGHGLTYRNTAQIVAITGIEELNIGHSIISHALFVGLDEAVREMLEIVRE